MSFRKAPKPHFTCRFVIWFQEDGNGRVLDTGLRNDVPALATLDAHLEANEFLLGSGEESD